MPIPTDFSPLETKMSTDDRFRRLERAHNNLEFALNKHMADADMAYPGADRRRHYDHHVYIDQKEIDRREFWKKVIPQVIGGLVIAGVAVVSTALLFFFRFGGR